MFSCGSPVLISHGVNLAIEVHQAGAGLVQADTSTATTQALQHWLSLSVAEQRRYGVNAKALFERRYRLDRTVDDLLEILTT